MPATTLHSTAAAMPAASTAAMATAVALSEHARRRAAQCCGQRKCNQSFEHHEGEFILLGIEPAFDPLRGDPRFQALVANLGIEKTPSRR